MGSGRVLGDGECGGGVGCVGAVGGGGGEGLSVRWPPPRPQRWGVGWWWGMDCVAGGGGWRDTRGGGRQSGVVFGAGWCRG